MLPDPSVLVPKFTTFIGDRKPSRINHLPTLWRVW
jgi:hypothetical protein